MRINLTNIQVYANHGCWKEEAIIGGEYIVDVWIDGPFEIAAVEDDLSLTVDYVAVKELVYAEMKVRAKLIETVLVRLHKRLKESFPTANQIGVRVTKINAPMGGQVNSVSVEMEG
ncbi:MAG: dihydroneopterin aldolase [Bacteroidota bacterium]